MKFEFSRAFAQSLDQKDNLSPFRERFYIPPTEDGRESFYFCGNSLGLQPKTVSQKIAEELEDWKKFGVEAHFRGRRAWKDYHELLSPGLAKIVGAKVTEVVAMNTLSVNLHLLMVSFYRPQGKRRKIMIEGGAFPSDRYAALSQIKFHGGDPQKDLIVLRPRVAETCLKKEDILEAIQDAGEELALVLLPGVQYYTGQVFPMKEISTAAHSVGAFAGFDLAHAVGNLELSLHDWDADFAAWCSYKYLNSGPGAVAGIFVHEKYFGKSLPRFDGWWGHRKETRFLMPENFEAMSTAEAWQISNPPIFSLTPLLSSLEIFDESGGMSKLVEKSKLLTRFYEFCAQAALGEKLQVITPAERGCQLSLQVPGGKKTYENLVRSGVICDWREPDVVRIAPTPLYNRFEEAFDFAQILKEALSE